MAANLLPPAEAMRRLGDGSLDCSALMRATLDEIARREPELHAFATIDGVRAMAQAEAADRLPPDRRGRLHGLSLAVKDTYDTTDFPSERGSRLWSGRRPQDDAVMVARARAAGAIVIGKSVTTEFALMHPGPTRNPHHPSHTPGGSSSGSAAAVAAGMAMLALGSQTNGSMLRPASYCGIFGIKPSFGVLPRTGLQPIAMTLDTPGVFSRDLQGLATAVEVLSGQDEGDPDSHGPALGDLAATLCEPGRGRWRVGFCRTPAWDRCDADAQAAMLAFVGRVRGSVEVTEVDLPAGFERLHDHHMVIQDSGAADQLQALARARPDDFSASLLDTVHRGSAITAQRRREALSFQAWARSAMDTVFDRFDVLMSLAATGEAPPSLSTTGDPAMQTVWTFTGTPALSMPALHGARGLPIGVQVSARRGRDADVLGFAALMQAQGLVPSAAPIPD